MKRFREVDMEFYTFKLPQEKKIRVVKRSIAISILIILNGLSMYFFLISFSQFGWYCSEIDTKSVKTVEDRHATHSSEDVTTVREESSDECVENTGHEEEGKQRATRRSEQDVLRKNQQS